MDLRRKAMDLLETAKESFEKGRFWLTCLSAHQAVELYLKGVLFELAGTYPFTHDLRLLLESLAGDMKVPEEVIDAADYLNPHYTASRYSLSMEYRKSSAERCLEYAEGIVKWVRENIERQP
ncbi:MAG: HEPN domain-containing protein [Candidatus Korarchaeota archaeon]|nr:HEPN domain-containing protein [Candidatus Korarchaeota archaeon]MDK2384688.1 HEPN domain-containing protein [Candidatus Korarchaeota archaeon]